MTNEKDNLFKENLNNKKINLKKSQLYGGRDGECLDDWYLINSKFSDHLIEKVKIKEFEIFYKLDLINCINFTYQITTDKGIFELKGNKFGTNNYLEGKTFIHCFANDEVIEKIAFNDSHWSLKVINGLQITTSKNFFYFGYEDCYKEFSTNSENLIIYGTYGGCLNSLGFYHSDYNELNEIIDENESQWIYHDFSAGQKKEWLSLGFQDTDFKNAKIWRDLFGFEKTKQWLNSGLDTSKYQQAYYWESDNQSPITKEELIALKEQGIEVSKWLDFFYPKNSICLFDDWKWIDREQKSNRGKKRSEIEYLYFPDSNLTGHLDLSDFINLITLNISNNKLKSFNLDNCVNLEYLYAGDNFYLTNPSLIQFKNLTKLKYLDINNSHSISTGLQYLPTSLEFFYCVFTKLFEKLTLYNHNFLNWQIYNTDLMKEVGREVIEFDYQNSELIAIITNPKFLKNDNKKNVQLNTNDQLTNLDYSKFLLRDDRPFSWEKQFEIQSKVLPTRLYQISTNQVIETKGDESINYATLSYVWGDSKLDSNKLSETEKKELDQLTKSIGYSNSNKMTKSGYKSWKKAIEAGNLLKFDYLWIDQLCINQNSPTDKGNEVRKMGGCYGNCSVTLISIDLEIGNSVDKNDENELAKHLIREIASSPWFTRAWTFQEGLLSKQTIFMFDDYLVDGRILAQYWGSFQHNNDGKIELKNPNLITYITPLGWNYFSQENVNLTLGEALNAISKRSQTVPIDGIYSILGLLTYGDQVETNYKEDRNYSIFELEKALREVTKVALKNNNYIDLFSWIGSRNNQLIPSINKNGTTNFKEILTRWSFENIKQSIIEINDQVIKLKNVESLQVSNSWKTNEHTSIISVQSSEKEETVNLYHSNDLIVEKGDYLIFFNTKEELSDLIEEIALLVPKNPQHSIYLCKYNSFLDLGFSEVLIDIKERKILSYLWCDNCNKKTIKEEIYFRNREENLDFCSSDCINSWKEENDKSISKELIESYSDWETTNDEEELSEIIEELAISG